MRAIPTAPGIDEPRDARPLLRTTAEIVVAGRAAAGTVLNIAGRRIAVGPDGGFSLRVPLGHGLADLSIEAVAEDGQRENLRLWFGSVSDRG